jgi:hypothetical protein
VILIPYYLIQQVIMTRCEVCGTIVVGFVQKAKEFHLGYAQVGLH